MTLVSVILFNYNHAKYLPESIESILNQTWGDLELIVVDDASTDASCAVVEQYQKTYKNLHLIKLSKNSGGPMVPMHIGLKHAQGAYVTFCSADDMILPSFIEKAMKFNILHPEVAICTGDYYLFQDIKPYRFKPKALMSSHKAQIFYPEQFVQICRNNFYYIASQTSLYRKDYVIECGGYDEELKGYSDFYLNYQIALRYPVAYIPQTWGAFRLVNNSFSRGLSYRARKDLCAKMMDRIEHESPDIQQKWCSSGLLAHAGHVMMIYLLQHQRYWKYFPTASRVFLLKSIKNKLWPIWKSITSKGCSILISINPLKLLK